MLTVGLRDRWTAEGGRRAGACGRLVAGQVEKIIAARKDFDTLFK